MNADRDSELRYDFRDYDLNEARKYPSKRIEAAHQAKALADLRAWYETAPTPNAGGLLVLPTGGGKTFTAVRFLCRNPLSDGYKVLWLAHTHHLLEQALDSFGKPNQHANEMEVGLIHEPKERLRARVVSGTHGHSKIAAVAPNTTAEPPRRATNALDARSGTSSIDEWVVEPYRFFDDTMDNAAARRAAHVRCNAD
ncbi:MAG: DEAD/DEAH box helicase family protein [Polyangiaceae bacterium]|nr:DEAD/DEAH box helicase family protein [Polyangiaceae bacterium]